jgi:hypothetical protein
MSTSSVILNLKLELIISKYMVITTKETIVEEKISVRAFPLIFLLKYAHDRL